MALVCFSLIGCKGVSDEQECLNSERLKFKDPEVVFVANLGSRGLTPVENQYWVRYKAKNSFGAYLQGNMICTKRPGSQQWVRDEGAEYLAHLKIKLNLSEQQNKLLKEGKIKIPYFHSADLSVAHLEAKLEEQVKNVLYTSPDNLDKYIGNR